MKISELRVKIKSLAEEARIIAHEERKMLRRFARTGGDAEQKAAAWKIYQELHDHRRAVVGSAAREALLAYGFLRGKPYGTLEPHNSRAPDWDSVWKVAERFAARGRLPPSEQEALARRWATWRSEAERHRDAEC